MSETKIVDFVPRTSLTGDTIKLFDSSMMKNNIVLVNLMNLLNMQRGSIPEFPDLGELDTVMELYFTTDDERGDIIRRLNTNIQKFINYPTEVTVKETDHPDHYEMVIKVMGLPSVITDVYKKDQTTKVMNLRTL